MNEVVSGTVTETISSSGNIFLEILLHGLTATNIISLSSTVFIIGASMGLILIMKEFVAGMLSCFSKKIKQNQLIKLEYPAGKIIAVKVLKIGIVSTLLLDIETGEDITMKNTVFNKKTVARIKTIPENLKRDYLDKTYIDFK